MFKQEKGFTLAEIVAGVIILMILATVVGLAVFGYIKDARVASLKEEAIAVENDLLTNAGSYDYEGKEASELGPDVRAVLGYHESKDTKLEGLVFEDKALRSEGEIHVGKLSMPEEELDNYDFSESGVKQMKGNGIGNEFYVYDELNQVESNVGLLGNGTLTLPGGNTGIDPEDYKVSVPMDVQTSKMVVFRDHGIYIKPNGQLQMWDNNVVDSDGDPVGWDVENHTQKTITKYGIEEGILDMTASGYGYVFIKSDGSLAGDPYKPAVPSGSDYVDIVNVDTDAHLALKENGDVVLWRGGRVNESAWEHLEANVPVDGEEKFMSLSTYAGVTLDGRIVEWFEDDSLTVPEGNHFMEVQCGYERCIAQNEDDELVYFGTTDSLGLDQVPTGTVLDYKLGGSGYAIAVEEDESLYTWGTWGTPQDSNNGLPASSMNFEEVFTDGICSLGVRTNGDIERWGKCDWLDEGFRSDYFPEHKSVLYYK